MAANFVQVPAAGTGLKVDTTEITVGANVVERQNICLADPILTTAAAVANVIPGTFPTQSYLCVADATLDGFKATYSAAFTALNPGTAATTDVFVLVGSATKTIRVLRFGISGTEATAAAYKDVVLSIRSAATTAGTSSTATIVPYDSSDPAGTAIFRGYTAAGTAGAAVGTIAAFKLFCPITGTPALVNPPVILDFGIRAGRAVVLRGIAQNLAVTFNGATPANAGSIDAWVEFTEE